MAIMAEFLNTPSMNTEIQLTEFLLTKSDKFDKLCRICLSENTEQSRSVYEECESGSIASVVMLCARVQIVCQDGFPDIICAPCLGDLEAANSFRVRCELSDSLLRKVYTDSDQSTAQEIEESKETLDVKEDVLGESWIKSELEDNADSDTQYDPLVEDSFEFPKVKNLKLKKSVKKTSKNSDFKLKMSKSQNEVERNYEDHSNSSPDDFTIEKEYKTQSFMCSLCSKTLSSHRALENHIRSMHNEKKALQMGYVTGKGKDRRFNCSECSYYTNFKSKLKCHSRTHTGEKPYKCDVCEASFSQSSGLYSHKKLHSDQMRFTCPECGKQFKHKNSIDRHKLVHTDAKDFICEICNNPYKTKKSLGVHMKRHLNIRNYSCEYCGRTFLDMMDLKYHAKMHTDTKDFECNICGFKTRFKRVLIGHLRRRHNGEKNVKCELCDYMGYDIYAVRDHMKRHSTERKYSCPICPVKFKSNNHINRHITRIHKLSYKVSDYAKT